MNKLVIALTAGVLALTGCSNTSEPTPVPNPTPVETTVNPAPTTDAPEPDPTREPTVAPTTDEPKPEPAPSVSSSEAGTPAVQFAERWGKRYPNVPEFLILKAANQTCRLLAEAPDNWTSDSETLAGIKAGVTLAGIEGSDGVEFAQDAQQNYCGSVSNPT
jgi:hypothetical protein